MGKKAISLDSEGYTLVGQVYIPEREGPHPTVCLCHGVPRGVRDPGDPGYPALAQRFCNAGFLTLIFNFRGTGDSGGNFDILGWTRDLKAALDRLYSMDEVDRGRIAVMGFSGGAAVSVYVAAKDERVSSVVTCACPARFRPIYGAQGAQSLLEHFRRIQIIRDRDFPPSIAEWIEGFNQVRPIDLIANISPRPLLIVHGTQDEVVDPSQAWELYSRAGEPKEILMVEGAGHRLRIEEKAVAGALGWLRSQFGRD